MATIRTEGMRGPLAKGLVVTSNDPDRPTMQLTVRVKVAGSVDLFPRVRLTLNLRDSAPEPARLLVRKEPEEPGTLTVADLVPSAPWLKASARKVTAPEEIRGLPAAAPGDFIVEVVSEGDVPVGQSVQQVQFRTGLTKEPVVTVPITVFVPPPVTFSTASLLLPAPAAGRPAEGEVFAVLRADVDPSGIKVETDTPGLQAKLEEAGPGPRRLRLKVSWKPSERQSDGLVTLTAKGQSFRLPVRITAPSGASAQGS